MSLFTECIDPWRQRNKVTAHTNYQDNGFTHRTEMAFMRTGNEVGSPEDLDQENNDLDQLWIASINIGNGKKEGECIIVIPINGGKIIHFHPLMLVLPLKSLFWDMNEREGRCIIMRPSIEPK